MNSDEFSTEVLIADALLRLKSLEDLLISKGIITKEEYDFATKEIAEKISKAIISKSNFDGKDSLIKKN